MEETRLEGQGGRSRHPGLIVVHVAQGLLKAQVIKAKLEDAGIPVLLDYESLGPIFGVTVDGLGEVRVLVPERYADEARALIEERVTEESAVSVRPLEPSDKDEWARLRAALWPDCPAEKHGQEMSDILRNPKEEAVFVSPGPDGRLQGFLEISIRPFAHGCESRPVGYIEGWYVEPDARRKGVGRALVAAAEEWARSKGCRGMASDAEIGNELSQLAHERLGYEEVERLVHFGKKLFPQ